MKYWLDGKEIASTLVTRFNTREGWIECKVPDGKGGYKVDPKTRAILREKKFGKVDVAKG